MPAVSADDQPDLLQRILSGELEIVLWSSPEDAAIFMWQTGLRPRVICDVTWRNWGKLVEGVVVRPPTDLEGMDPARTVVVNFFHGTPVWAECVAFADAAGGFRTVAPFDLDAIAEALGLPEGGAEGEAVEEIVAATLGLMEASSPHARAAGSRRLVPPSRRADVLAEILTYCRDSAVAAGRRAAPDAAGLFIGGLFAGGAERQICELAVGFRERQWRPRLYMLDSVVVESQHYLRFLQDNGVDHVTVPPGSNRPDAFPSALAGVPEPMRALLWHLPHLLVGRIIRAWTAAIAAPPRVAVCYLDWPNAIAGIAALCAGAERVLLSGRNIHPGNFPHFFAHSQAAFLDVYRILARHPRVTISNNSAAGGMSYADWIGMDRERVAVVHNCVAEEALESEAAAAPATASGDGGPLILGVFRLTPEKNPYLFLDVVERVRAVIPNVRAELCGTGALAGAVAAAVAERGLGGTVVLRGVVGNVASLMRSATILLHTADAEGTPNVILEAQAVGLPVVCTAAGGTQEIVVDALAAFVRPVGDAEGLSEACLRLLRDESLRASVAEETAREARRRFSRAALVESTLEAAGLGEPALYDTV